MIQRKWNNLSEVLMDEGLMYSDAKIIPFSSILKDAFMPKLLAPFDELNTLASSISSNKAKHMAKERIKNKQDLQRVLQRYNVSEAEQAIILRNYDKRALPFLFGDDARKLATELTNELYPAILAMLTFITQVTYDRYNKELGGRGITPKKVNTNWSGKRLKIIIYSVLITLLRRRNETLSQGLLTNKSNAEILTEVNTVVSKAMRHIQTISRTEASQVVNTAILEALIDNDVQKYTFIATLDSRTSKICRSLHNKVFLVTEARRGENFPPMHPNCRSVIAPVLIF